MNSSALCQTTAMNSGGIGLMQIRSGYRAATYPHPYSWQQGDSDNWFGIVLNGPADLIDEEPIMEVNQHEAQAYASWVAGHNAITQLLNLSMSTSRRLRSIPRRLIN